MTTKREIVIWLQSACRSVMPLCRKLADIEGLSVRVVLRKALSDDRKRLGWSPDESGNAHTTTIEDDNWKASVDDILDRSSSVTHLVGGYQRDEFLRYVAQSIAGRRQRLFIMSEAPLNMEHGFRRPVKDLYLSHVLRRRVSSIVHASERIFSLSGRRFECLEALGWPSHKIVPFGYFPADRKRRSPERLGSTAPVQLLCVGFLNRYKGVDVLLRAISLTRLPPTVLNCQITGDGPEKARLVEISRSLGLEQHVKFHGIVADSRLDELFESSDVLVVPGRQEPWAIRINEGIQAGLAVVVSDRVGAADLVGFGGVGTAFRSDDAGELSSQVSALVASRRLLEMRKCASRAYRQWIEPELAAQYLLECINTDSKCCVPTAPWFSSSALSAVTRSIADCGERPWCIPEVIAGEI